MNYEKKLRRQQTVIYGVLIALVMGPLAIFVFHTTHTDYFYDPSGKVRLAVTQHNSLLGRPEVYFSRGRVWWGRPLANYIRVNMSDRDFCYRFSGDTLTLELYNWQPIEKKLDPDDKLFVVYPDHDKLLPHGYPYNKERATFFSQWGYQGGSCKSANDLAKNWRFTSW